MFSRAIEGPFMAALCEHMCNKIFTPQSGADQQVGLCIALEPGTGFTENGRTCAPESRIAFSTWHSSRWAIKARNRGVRAQIFVNDTQVGRFLLLCFEDPPLWQLAPPIRFGSYLLGALSAEAAFRCALLGAANIIASVNICLSVRPAFVFLVFLFCSKISGHTECLVRGFGSESVFAASGRR